MGDSLGGLSSVSREEVMEGRLSLGHSYGEDQTLGNCEDYSYETNLSYPWPQTIHPAFHTQLIHINRGKSPQASCSSPSCRGEELPRVQLQFSALAAN